MSQLYRYIKNNGNLGPVDTLTGNDGVHVPADAMNNINVIGGTGVNITGNIGTNTLTVVTTSVLNYTLVAVSPYVVTATDQFLGVSTGLMAITVQLPNVPVVGRVYMIKDILGNAAANNITVTTVGGGTFIDGVFNYVMNTNYAAVQVVFNGISYSVF